VARLKAGEGRPLLEKVRPIRSSEEPAASSAAVREAGQAAQAIRLQAALPTDGQGLTSSSPAPIERPVRRKQRPDAPGIQKSAGRTRCSAAEGEFAITA
jgi:hypothetical protein